MCSFLCITRWFTAKKRIVRISVRLGALTGHWPLNIIFILFIFYFILIRNRVQLKGGNPRVYQCRISQQGNSRIFRMKRSAFLAPLDLHKSRKRRGRRKIESSVSHWLCVGASRVNGSRLSYTLWYTIQRGINSVYESVDPLPLGIISERNSEQKGVRNAHGACRHALRACYAALRSPREFVRKCWALSNWSAHRHRLHSIRSLDR